MQEGATGEYLVHVTDKRRFTRLHKRGGCWRKLGRELKIVQYYDRIEDAPVMAFCEQCWPKGFGEAPEFSGVSAVGS